MGCSNSKIEHQDNQAHEKLVIRYEANGYLDQGIIDDIRKEQLRIKAISAYEYALPIVGIEQWHKGFLKEAEHGDWLIYKDRASKIPIITANTTTP
jgi:hypothetical protein